MYGPHVAILLICVSRNTRRVDFRGLMGSQRTPRVWGITISISLTLSLIIMHNIGLGECKNFIVQIACMHC